MGMVMRAVRELVLDLSIHSLLLHNYGFASIQWDLYHRQPAFIASCLAANQRLLWPTSSAMTPGKSTPTFTPLH